MAQSMKHLSIYLRETIRLTYGKYVASGLVSFKPHSSSYRMKFVAPPLLAHSSTPNYLSTSALLATFDELSGVTMMLTDKTGRGGVSVHLTTEVLKPIQTGSIYTMDIHTDKVGKFLGFSRMDAYDDNGVLLARGTHTKFLPMGYLIDFINLPLVQPVVVWLYHNVFKTKYTTLVDSMLQEASEKDIIAEKKDSFLFTEPAGSIFDLFLLIPSEKPENNDPKISAFEFRVRKETRNIVGLMHGGAVAGAIEKACHLHHHSYQQPHNKSIISMEIKYLSASKGDVIVEVQDDPHVSNQSIGVIRSKKSPAVSVNVQFTCRWGEL